MKPSLHLALLFAFILSVSYAEEWYEPDSHLINAQQFQELVINDKTAFKIVKYFSPHCGFCRFLKQVVDKLKHEKQWCFKIYDFNCAVNPQHCMQNVRSPSFPYTAIHNADGNLHEEIHGFYPEPVIRTIFDRIQGQCLEIRNAKIEDVGPFTANSLQATEEHHQQLPPGQVQPNEIVHTNDGKTQQKIEAKVEQKPAVVESKAEEPAEAHEQAKPIQNKLDEAKIPLQQQQITVQQPTPSKQPNPKVYTTSHGVKVEQSNLLKYLIYGGTFLISIYYFHHINKGKQLQPPASHEPQHQQSTPLLQQNNKISEQQSQVQQILQQQSQLIASIPDEQL